MTGTQLILNLNTNMPVTSRKPNDDEREKQIIILRIKTHKNIIEFRA